MGDEKLYKKVENELAGKPRKYTDRALMTKAEVLSGGDEKKKRYKYIELRVEQLKEKERQKIEEANRRLEERLEERTRRREEREEERRREAELKEANEQLKREEEELAEIEKKKEKTNIWILVGMGIAGLVFGRLFGFLGVASVGAGYLTYEYLKKKKSTELSVLAAVIVAFISYFIGVAIIASI